MRINGLSGSEYFERTNHRYEKCSSYGVGCLSGFLRLVSFFKASFLKRVHDACLCKKKKIIKKSFFKLVIP